MDIRIDFHFAAAGDHHERIFIKIVVVVESELRSAYGIDFSLSAHESAGTAHIAKILIIDLAVSHLSITSHHYSENMGHGALTSKEWLKHRSPVFIITLIMYVWLLLNEKYYSKTI